MMAMDMKKALRQAALLRNRLEGCLRAASAPMTGREIAEWPSVQEVTGLGLPGYTRLSTQLRQMVSRGQLSQIGRGQSTTYAWCEKSPTTSTGLPPDLKLRIDRKANTLQFCFAGATITIEVAQ